MRLNGGDVLASVNSGVSVKERRRFWENFSRFVCGGDSMVIQLVSGFTYCERLIAALIGSRFSCTVE